MNVVIAAVIAALVGLAVGYFIRKTVGEFTCLDSPTVFY